jgi:hypothetical protein
MDDGVLKEAYRVEIERSGCVTCDAGKMYRVVGPDDVAMSTIYEREEDAIDLADDLNIAYAAGLAEGHKQDSKFTYCAYCGHEERLDVDGSVIAAHIRSCEKHPARQWETEAFERGRQSVLESK